MSLESDKRLHIQLRLDFPSAPTGEARQALREDIESFFSNRRIRTRTYGGVGGAEPRGSPLSRSMAQTRSSAMSALSPLFGEKQT